VFISGRVQGVFFRLFTEKTAKRLNLTGWVRNLPDGRVETMAEGSVDKLRTFVKRLKRGSLASKVTSLEISWSAYKGEFKDFERLPTK
jgi:acylphosphatase